MKRSPKLLIRFLATITLVSFALAGCYEKKTPPPPSLTAPPEELPAPTVQLMATPNTVSSGEQVQLSWHTTGATFVSIDGLGDVPSSGVKTVTPTVSITYHLQARGAGGTSDATVRVTVNTPPSPPPPPTSSESRDEFKDRVHDILFNAGAADIRSDQLDRVASDAGYLNEHPSLRVVIFGYADEPGSEEHNIALGEERANETKIYLVGQGVAADRIRILSYGREKQFCSETTEQCKQLNRRAQIAIDNSPQAATPRIPTRDFLRSGEPEKNGYGLYSYILFTAPPTSANRDAYRVLIQIYLSEIRPKEEYQPQAQTQDANTNASTPPPASDQPILSGQLNIIYLPVTKEIDHCISLPVANDLGKAQQDCILDQAYDYRRALNLLHEIDALQPPSTARHLRGPYIISTLLPIDKIGRASNLVYLNQDLTRVPQNVVQDHVNEFLDETSLPLSITRKSIQRFMLNLRTSIAQSAGPMDNVTATISLIWEGKSN